MKRTMLFALLIVLFTAVFQLLPRSVESLTDLYVSPAGSPWGNGSINNPWDLATALKQPASVTSGKTIYLRGGTYRGRFTSNLINAVVRSYPGEWARIDGNYSVSLAAAIPPAAQGARSNIQLASAANIEAGANLRLGENEIVYVIDVQRGNVLEVVRGWAGTQPQAHAAGTQAAVSSNIFTVQGANTVYRDFEIFDSSPDNRVLTKNYDALTIRGTGVAVRGDNLKLINLIIHDCLDGVDAPESPQNLEIYGLLLYNNGFVDPARGHGYGLYLQNRTGFKRIENVISFNNFAGGMKAFGETAFVENISFDGVIAFNNGAPATFANNPAQKSANNRFVNLHVGTNCNTNDIKTCTNPIKNIEIKNSLLYQPQTAVTELGNLRVGYVTRGGQNVFVNNNQVFGGHLAFEWIGVQTGEFSGNSLGAGETLANVNVDAGARLVWNKNAYWTTFDYPFGYPETRNRLGGGLLTFDDAGNSTGKGWRQWTGFDTNSGVSRAKPKGVQTFVRPNKYEQGRAHIAVYNWDLRPVVQVDLTAAGLVPGQRFEIRNAQDYFGEPVLAANTFTAGMKVNLPTTLKAVTVIGVPPAANLSTAPEFCVYIVVPLGAGNSFQTASPKPSNLPATPKN